MRIEVVLDVFSGRPNPTWTLDSEEVAEFLQRLNGLQFGLPSEAVKPPALGYRGFLAQAANGQTELSEPIRVYGGTVWQGEKILKDSDRALEKWLLQTGASSIERKVLGKIKESFARS
jgi:hypothetical protein